MPSLRSIGDSAELDNRYIDKCVVYVEGDDDEGLWRFIVGVDVGDRIEFKVPLTLGSGHEVVYDRVRIERPRNPKIYGLLDGEAAASFGQVGRLINATDAEIVFELDTPELEGILFLVDHEIENVILRHSNLTGYIQNHVTKIKSLGSRNVTEIDDQLLSLARRFFIAALFKYASAHLKATGAGCGVLNVDRFRAPGSVLAVVRAMKQLVQAEGAVNPSAFMREVFAIARLLRSRVQTETMSAQKKGEHIFRLAEGKGFQACVHRNFKLQHTCDAHLAERLKTSPYAAKFKEAILAATVGRDRGMKAHEEPG